MKSQDTNRNCGTLAPMLGREHTRNDLGVVAVEYVVLLTFVCVLAMGAIILMGGPLLTRYLYTEAILAAPVP